MRAGSNSTATASPIAISDAFRADAGDEVHSRAIVAPADLQPVEVQLLYPDLGSASRSLPWPTATRSTLKRFTPPRSLR